MDGKNQTWGEDSYEVKVEHLNRKQMREVQKMLEDAGWDTIVEKRKPLPRRVQV